VVDELQMSSPDELSLAWLRSILGRGHTADELRPFALDFRPDVRRVAKVCEERGIDNHPLLRLLAPDDLSPATVSAALATVEKLSMRTATAEEALPVVTDPADLVLAGRIDRADRGEALEPLPDDAVMNHVDLANKLGIDREALRKRLQRWRRDNMDGWQEIADAKAREPRYLYRVGAIRHLLYDAS
jgi:hypothetical protein